MSAKAWFFSLVLWLAVVLVVAVSVADRGIAYTDYVSGNEVTCVAVSTVQLCMVQEATMYARHDAQHERWEDGSGQWVIDYCLSGALCDDKGE